eukprot:CAMPEP_0176359012 /NCGR_PEP_ID=MMETSP0126-20121128/15996_1 /TAXON_ID=141414 ORGANISM="Strombidinopsis acuminatum, Strain SPMC142" /NCGR_SAMPLE_ID=MMETSP0126 /ASSEMBLY_ACC=CAM_ASM_000229 /LENGTH=46 /DNA_ID= /DNA_START= /DNA_END= /DNA_ORIENTATION=
MVIPEDLSKFEAEALRLTAIPGELSELANLAFNWTLSNYGEDRIEL